MLKEVLTLVRLSRHILRRIMTAERDGHDAAAYRHAFHLTVQALSGLLTGKITASDLTTLNAFLDKSTIGAKIRTMDMDGGPGSGNWGHAGRPGKVGGSSSKRDTLKGKGLQFFANKSLKNQTPAMLKRGIKSFEERIKEHEGYLKNPRIHAPAWDTYTPAHQESLKKHWCKEIQNFRKSIDERKQELKERGIADD